MTTTATKKDDKGEKLIKGFEHDGKTYQEGDEFEGSATEVDLLRRQHYLAPEKDEDKKQPPPAKPPETKAKLIKGFVHDGRAYQEGDDFEGAPEEIAALRRQGYIAPKESDGESDSAPPSADVSASSSGSAHVTYQPPVPGAKTAPYTEPPPTQTKRK